MISWWPISRPSCESSSTTHFEASKHSQPPFAAADADLKAFQRLSRDWFIVEHETHINSARQLDHARHVLLHVGLCVLCFM